MDMQGRPLWVVLAQVEARVSPNISRLHEHTRVQAFRYFEELDQESAIIHDVRTSDGAAEAWLVASRYGRHLDSFDQAVSQRWFTNNAWGIARAFRAARVSISSDC